MDRKPHHRARLRQTNHSGQRRAEVTLQADQRAELQFPFYARLSLVLLLLTLLGFIVYIGSNVLMPLLMSTFFAILLRPIVVFMTRKMHFPHVLAVLTAVICFLALIAAVIIFISAQFSTLADDLPSIRENLGKRYQELQVWVSDHLHISRTNQERYISRMTQDKGDHFVGSTLFGFSITLLHAVLIPVFTFLVLYYRNLFKKFLSKLVKRKNHHTLIAIMTEVKVVIQSYIVGLLIEMGIVATLAGAGLFLIGVPYAILLGVLTAFLNLVPYIGMLCATLLALLAASINSTGISVPLEVMGIYLGVHLLDNNFLVPKIVASKVKLNALVSLVGVFVGSQLAGMSGMFLAIPTIAILKVVFDRIDPLKPWGFLMGDELPRSYEWGGVAGRNVPPQAETKEEKIAKDVSSKE